MKGGVKEGCLDMESLVHPYMPGSFHRWLQIARYANFLLRSNSRWASQNLTLGIKRMCEIAHHCRTDYQ